MVGYKYGLVHLTKDGGETWDNITPKNLEETIINAIDISPHDKGTVYIATTRYKFNDKTPGLYKSTNYGKSWKDISGNIPYGAYTRVVREDNVKRDLLFAGTELGVYISFNGGKEWEEFNLNMPSLAVTDLMIKHNDLIIATQGRSFWILDDMGLIRQYSGSEKTSLFKPENSITGGWYSQLNSKPKPWSTSSPCRRTTPRRKPRAISTSQSSSICGTPCKRRFRNC